MKSWNLFFFFPVCLVIYASILKQHGCFATIPLSNIHAGITLQPPGLVTIAFSMLFMACVSPQAASIFFVSRIPTPGIVCTVQKTRDNNLEAPTGQKAQDPRAPGTAFVVPWGLEDWIHVTRL